MATMDTSCEPIMRSINQITTVRLPDGTEVAFVDWTDKPLYSSADFLDGWTDQEVDYFQYTDGDPVPKTSNITTARNSTTRDTNLATPGSNASTEEMLVYAVRPEIFEYKLTTPQEGAGYDASLFHFADVNQPQPSRRRLSVFHEACLIILEVTQKWTIQAGFGYFNTGFGVNSYSALQTQPGFVFDAPGALSLRTAATQGLPAQSAVRSLTIPVHIGGQEKWRLHVDNFRGIAVPSGILEVEPTGQAEDAATDPDVMHTVRIYLDGLYKRPVT